mgnify:CR=1 FL=1
MDIEGQYYKAMFNNNTCRKNIKKKDIKNPSKWDDWIYDAMMF